MMRADVAPMAATATNHVLIDAGSRAATGNIRKTSPYSTSDAAAKFLNNAFAGDPHFRAHLAQGGPTIF
jgi:hypothetical protein